MIIQWIMNTSMLFFFVLFQGLIYLTGIVYAICAYAHKRIGVGSLLISFVLFPFPPAIPLVCFYGERRRAKHTEQPVDGRRIEAGWLLVLFAVLTSGGMNALCRTTGADTDLGLSCSLLATLLASWLVLWLVRPAHRCKG